MTGQGDEFKFASSYSKRFHPDRFLHMTESSLGRCNCDEGFWRRTTQFLNHGQVTWTTPETGTPSLTTTPHTNGRDVPALDRF
ncbi:hypothetical protein TNCV_4748901 [Trichonephila clavipes]|nr:hypothetical protein TNCV_4748901 [Trichonephila clavipes]